MEMINRKGGTGSLAKDHPAPPRFNLSNLASQIRAMTGNNMDNFTEDFNGERSGAAVTTIDFHGDTLFAMHRNGDTYVAIKPICEALGLAWHGQRERIRRDPILSEGMVITPIPSAGGTQDTACLRLDLVNGWLFTIEEGRVKDEAVRQRVLLYKRECYQALFRHFHDKAAAAVAEVPHDHGPGAEILVLPDAARLWIDLVREARILRGRRAAIALWGRSPLPTLPAEHDIEEAGPMQLRAFLAEATEPAPGASIGATPLYKAYVMWCRQNRARPASIAWFGRNLPVDKRRSGSMHYWGIRLRPEAEAA
ncbi:phage antirepressor N-terminal domain-containing protein [Inquilinus sp. CA228]|uniref:phage antirepressor N-terminal domain-containing protein n=1 Tax=Inquilinus sp. CA228 TaxID=3455609 RepID=UPI003F8D25D0